MNTKWLLICAIAAWMQNASGEEIMLRISTHTIQVTTAHTPAQRETGLMKTTSLCPDCGMLFIFPFPDTYGFWMKNTPLPLSIAFIDESGTIQDIQELKPNSLKIIQPHQRVLYALEMKQGWFSRKDIQAGAKVRGLHQAPLGQ